MLSCVYSVKLSSALIFCRRRDQTYCSSRRGNAGSDPKGELTTVGGAACVRRPGTYCVTSQAPALMMKHGYVVLGVNGNVLIEIRR